MKKSVLLIYLFCLTKINAQLFNEKVNILKGDTSEFTIDKQYVFSEKKDAKDINFVLKNDKLFKYQNKKLINQGINKKYHWLKINIKNNTNKNNFVFEFNQTNIDSLRFFVIKGEHIILDFPTKGLHYTKNNQPSFLSNKYAYLYNITLPKNKITQIYIRADVNDDPFRVVNKIWTIEGYATRKKQIKIKSAYLIAFLGFVIIALLLSLSMFYFTKKLLYVYYVGFVATLYLNLMVLRYFISPIYIEKILFNGNNFSEMFGYLQMTFVLLYSNEFLEIKKIRPKISKLINKGVIFTLLMFLLALFLRKYAWFYNASYVVSKVFMFTASVLLYAFALRLAFRKNIMAIYYVVAYAPLMQFMIHYILTAMRLTSSYNPLEWEVVIFIEIIVLTVAMGHRYFLLMKENTNYQLAIIKEKEKGMQAMIQAQENERTRIARELHDGVVQQIGSVILKSRNALSRLNLLETLESQEILKSLENSNQDLRNISHQMMPRALNELGLLAALEDLLHGSLVYKNIKVNFEHFNINERLPNKIEITLYRIIQELVNNIIKHSEASKVDIQLFKSNGNVILIVEDNGIGISRTNKKGIGLLNINNRLDMVNGKVNFEPSPESGTLVTIKIPL